MCHPNHYFFINRSHLQNLWKSFFHLSFFQSTGRRGTFSFSRKICKAAPILISGSFLKNFTLMPLALCDGTTAQLQICSSERNVPLLPVDWKTIRKRMMPANPVCGTNIKAPEPAVKGTPQKELRIPWTGINIKIPC